MTHRPDLQAQDPSNTGITSSERRSDPVLRALIDDMLVRVRELNRNAGAWSRDRHEQAVAELDFVMARIRRTAAERKTA